MKKIIKNNNNDDYDQNNKNYNIYGDNDNTNSKCGRNNDKIILVLITMIPKQHQ